jgi:hypothetical protein
VIDLKRRSRRNFAGIDAKAAAVSVIPSVIGIVAAAERH